MKIMFCTLCLLVAGCGFALQGPLYAAALYLWIAYFRPETWAWSDVFKTLDLSYFAGAYLDRAPMAVGSQRHRTIVS